MPAITPASHAAPGAAVPGPQARSRATGGANDVPVETALFASDLHLCAEQPRGVERACAFLAHARELGADHVFLLGDVFKAWLGEVSLRDRGLAPFLDALRVTTGAGVRVALLHGNHDFLVGPELERATGVRVAGERLDVALGGQRVRLEHGDGFCTRDVGHQRLHAVLRSRPVRGIGRRLPATTLRWLARRLLAGTEGTTSRKPPEVMDIVDEAVVATLRTGYDAVLCGHVHVARDQLFDLGARHGRLVVMADFETMGSHAVYRDGRLECVPFDKRLSCCAGIVVTLDGPAGSGKSSVSRTLAQRLGFACLDSGALYRVVTARALTLGIPLDDGERLGQLARQLDLAVEASGAVRSAGALVPDGELRGPEVSAHVSQVSVHPELRAALLAVQRRTAVTHPGVVAEGRDMATVVFPQADVAVFLDARADVRAARRVAQNPGEGETVDRVRAALEARDARDSSRAVAPLSRAPGAVLLDTSELSQDEVIERLEQLVRRASPGRSTEAGG